MTRALAATAATPSSPGDAAARHRLEDVYARPPLDRLDRPREQGAADRVAAAVDRLLGWLVDHLGRGGSVALGIAVLGVAAALTVWLLSRVVARRRRGLAEPVPEPAADPDAEWRAALAAAALGDHREAVRRAFRSALLAVAVRGRLSVDAASTNRELLARVRADADLVAALAPAAAGFERAWYGGRPVGAADWETARARCEAIRALARRAGPVAAAP